MIRFSHEANSWMYTHRIDAPIGDNMYWHRINTSEARLLVDSGFVIIFN